MEKRTVLAILLCTVIIIGWGFLQARLFPPEPEAAPASGQDTAAPAGAPGSSGAPGAVEPVPVTEGSAPGTAANAGAGASGGAAAAGTGTDTAGAVTAGTGPDAAAADTAAPAVPVPEREERVVIETDLIRAELSSLGGDMVSFRLKNHSDKGEMVEMILPGEGNDPHAFTVAFGDLNARPVDASFRVSRPDSLTVEFSRDFRLAAGSGPGLFTLTKRYEFKDGEYMFRLGVSISGDPGAALNINGAAYTLGFGPQIGPSFQKLDNRYEYRHYYTLTNGKRRTEKVGENPAIIDNRITWAAIAGKYFTAIAVPDNTLYQLAFSSRPEPGLSAASRMYLVRPAANAGINDTFHFYLGPKNQENLGRYDIGDNGFKMRDLSFSRAADTSGFLAPLETLFKWALQVFYRLIPNYGVAIILLTLAVKLLMFPLTKKSSEASIKMQAIAPKIKELQDKYRDNPAKMNAELGALYKKEGHNPMSGCLPLLIQMPILFAMYNLFNTHFDLRGALFIPGWIPDLSLPESVYTFGAPLPLLGWDALRLLPFIYVGSQLLYGVATRTPEQQGNASMKMMMYIMPVMFFFILYNVPSGLLVFWIMSNVLTLIQQVILNRYLAGKRAAVTEPSGPPPVIAPPRRKKKR
ncbi:MAG: membrane protein insertase YidC [Treponema sp.]|jgi:YidC/Oxa1 family membrane protein insertase|nr:membrane protein insertase YidC [Treponema sp.]